MGIEPTTPCLQSRGSASLLPAVTYSELAKHCLSAPRYRPVVTAVCRSYMCTKCAQFLSCRVGRPWRRRSAPQSCLSRASSLSSASQPADSCAIHATEPTRRSAIQASRSSGSNRTNLPILQNGMRRSSTNRLTNRVVTPSLEATCLTSSNALAGVWRSDR